MKVIKVLSNNAIIATTDDQQEMVAIGRGIGFGKQPGDEVDPADIESQFVKKASGMTDVLAQLTAAIPTECLFITQQVIVLAKSRLNIDVQETLFFALSDHISFAVERFKKGLEIKNILLWDIKQFYRAEFAVAMEALALINQKLQIELPEDEAGFLALHLANATNNNMQSTMQSAGMIKDILNIIKYDLRIKFDERSIDYQRIITHLKFFSLRLLNRTPVNHNDPSIYAGIQEAMPASYQCVLKINDYVTKNHQSQLTADELMFLTIHINRLKPA
ncbi:transcriptional antiterminator [Enterobacterales bacterium]|nr:transcriptional antiterminator [Enterobacterales bacterium]